MTPSVAPDGKGGPELHAEDLDAAQGALGTDPEVWSVPSDQQIPPEEFEALQGAVRARHEALEERRRVNGWRWALEDASPAERTLLVVSVPWVA